MTQTTGLSFRFSHLYEEIFKVSHIVTIKTELRCLDSIQAACKRLNIQNPEFKLHKLFTKQVEGYGIKLPGWIYPVVVQPETGSVQFDNYGGKWGRQEELDLFLQAYAVEKAKLEVRRKGHAVFEQPLSDGAVKLTILVGGAA
jgi:hypothetical protein